MSNPVPQCTHIKTNGEVCCSPAVSGTDFCYHHSAVKTALGKVKPQAGSGGFAPIPFVFPEDRASMQINFFLLLQAFNEGQVDLRTYRAFLSMLKSMAANLGKTGSLVDEPSDQPSAVSVQKDTDMGSGHGARKESAGKAASVAELFAAWETVLTPGPIAPQSCFSKDSRVQELDNDLFRISTLELAGHGSHQAGRPMTR